jgi:hypothetical protein
MVDWDDRASEAKRCAGSRLPPGVTTVIDVRELGSWAVLLTMTSRIVGLVTQFCPRSLTRSDKSSLSQAKSNFAASRQSRGLLDGQRRNSHHRGTSTSARPETRRARPPTKSHARYTLNCEEPDKSAFVFPRGLQQQAIPQARCERAGLVRESSGEQPIGFPVCDGDGVVARSAARRFLVEDWSRRGCKARGFPT